MVKVTMKTPCEIMVWHVLPDMQKEIVKNFIENHRLTLRKAANKLGITKVVISRYLSGKKGNVELLRRYQLCL